MVSFHGRFTHDQVMWSVSSRASSAKNRKTVYLGLLVQKLVVSLCGHAEVEFSPFGTHGTWFRSGGVKFHLNDFRQGTVPRIRLSDISRIPFGDILILASSEASHWSLFSVPRDDLPGRSIEGDWCVVDVSEAASGEPRSFLEILEGWHGRKEVVSG